MLVVDSIVPGSHAEAVLEPGDVVCRVEGRVLTHFLELEEILDSAVGSTVALDVERGGQPIHVSVQVTLHTSHSPLCTCSNNAYTPERRLHVSQQAK